MKPALPEYPQVAGKTYSLFGQSDSTFGYYKTICELADTVVAMYSDTLELVDELEGFSNRKKRLKDALKHKNGGDRMHEILNLIDPPLRKYTENTEQHLKDLPLTKIWDRRLATSREQYHLYMLEIELTFGMRSCRSRGIPVMGIPLNANRCIRWFGEFFPNSVDLQELERLVTGGLVV
jgi:hypothetical protein